MVLIKMLSALSWKYFDNLEKVFDSEVTRNYL